MGVIGNDADDGEFSIYGGKGRRGEAHAVVSSRPGTEDSARLLKRARVRLVLSGLS